MFSSWLPKARCQCFSVLLVFFLNHRQKCNTCKNFGSLNALLARFLQEFRMECIVLQGMQCLARFLLDIFVLQDSSRSFLNISLVIDLRIQLESNFYEKNTFFEKHWRLQTCLRMHINSRWTRTCWLIYGTFSFLNINFLKKKLKTFHY